MPERSQLAPRTSFRNISRPHVAVAVQTCRGCDLYAHATQAVSAKDRTPLRLFLIGEQPGDEEDRRAILSWDHPANCWIGALVEAGIDRSLVYVNYA